jgi:hypothetical protein
VKVPGGERRYSSYSFLTSALDGGEWSASCPGRTLPPGKGSLVQEAGWAPEPVWTQRLKEKSSVSVGDQTSIVQSDTILTELPWLLISTPLCNENCRGMNYDGILLFNIFGKLANSLLNVRILKWRFKFFNYVI